MIPQQLGWSEEIGKDISLSFSIDGKSCYMSKNLLSRLDNNPKVVIKDNIATITLKDDWCRIRQPRQLELKIALSPYGNSIYDKLLHNIIFAESNIIDIDELYAKLFNIEYSKITDYELLETVEMNDGYTGLAGGITGGSDELTVYWNEDWQKVADEHNIPFVHANEYEDLYSLIVNGHGVSFKMDNGDHCLETSLKMDKFQALAMHRKHEEAIGEGDYEWKSYSSSYNERY